MKDLSLLYYSQYQQFVSYGIVANLLVPALEAAGVKVARASPPAIAESIVGWCWGMGQRSSLRHVDADIAVVHGLPHWRYWLPERLRARAVSHMMVETTAVPAVIQPFLPAFRAVVVPSPGQVPLFAAVTGAPVHVIPDPINTEVFQPVERPKRDTFTFIVAGNLTERKMPTETASWFLDAFPTEPDVRLILKTIPSAEALAATKTLLRDPRIRLIPRMSSQAQLHALYAQADAGIFLSHGEGFFLAPVEAMATGLPVIAPSHSGCVAWADPMYCYPLGLDQRCPFIPARGVAVGADGKPEQWWHLAKEDCIAQLRYVYAHREGAKTKGKLASAWVRESFNPTVAAKQWVALLGTL